MKRNTNRRLALGLKSGRTYPLNAQTRTFGGPLSAPTLAGEISRVVLGR